MKNSILLFGKHGVERTCWLGGILH